MRADRNVSQWLPAIDQPAGHHQILIQTLALSLGLPTDRVFVLDALRKKRNLNDDNGDPIEDAAVKQCLREGKSLLDEVDGWLKKQHPQLMSGRT